jgi:hypothetical protein
MWGFEPPAKLKLVNVSFIWYVKVWGDRRVGVGAIPFEREKETRVL